jgi:arsenate reductase
MEKKKPVLKKVLFICTHNSARSHMAEGFMNALYSDRYLALSAGTEPSCGTLVTTLKALGVGISSLAQLVFVLLR